MKTPEQLKGSIRSMATKKNLRAHFLFQEYFPLFKEKYPFERRRV